MRAPVTVALVRAAQAGDREALAEVLAAYLPVVYNVVGRALHGHADVAARDAATHHPPLQRADGPRLTSAVDEPVDRERAAELLSVLSGAGDIDDLGQRA